MSRSIKVLSGHPVQKILLGQAQLEDFLSEGEFVEAMFAIRWRLIRVFTNARSAPGRRATPGYIIGLNQQIASLAAYLQRSMGPRVLEKVFSVADVTGEYRMYPKKDRELIARYVQAELIMRQLLLMRDVQNLWYINGEWWMQQSTQDEYALLFKGTKESFRNQASFHGRPNRDRARLRGLRLAPGISTSVS